jgi:hemoglobin
MNPDAIVYQLIGTEGFTRLTAAFYRRVRADDLLGPMYPQDDWDGSEERLRDFLVFRFGGPQHYVVQRGHPRLRMRHAPFQVDQRARDRWVQLMTAALDEVQLPEAARGPLLEFFHNTATFMINHAPPPRAGLPLTE